VYSDVLSENSFNTRSTKTVITASIQNHDLAGKKRLLLGAKQKTKIDTLELVDAVCCHRGKTKLCRMQF
jgi:hypothetical protein